MVQKRKHPKTLVKMKQVILPLLVLLLGVSDVTTAFAAQPGFSELGAGYAAVLYDNSNGLPTSEANAVAQTEDGFIWIGGYSGLIRYDGNDFYRFDSATGITSVVSLYVDSKDRLWIGTNDNGAALYENGEFLFFGRNEGLNSLSVRSITEDGAGNIILATTQGLAYVDAQKELHILEDSLISEEYICEVKRDADGIIYGQTLDGAFFSVENLTVTAYYSGQELGIGVVSCICPDPYVKGQVYLGTEGSAMIRGSMLNGMKDYEVLPTGTKVNINAISPVGDDIIWVCADNGIGYLNARDEFVEPKNIPMDNSVDEMLEDYEGNLWFASSRQGVMKLVASPFTNVSGLAGLRTEVVNTTCIYQKNLYIGTDNGLRIVDSQYEQQENVLTELLEGIRIRCIREDSKGNLWLCTYGNTGLVCYHGDGTYTIYNEESGLLSNRVRTVTELSDGTIAAAISGGVNLIRDGRIVETYNEKDGIKNTEILSICEGENGRIYLGSDGNGIYIIEDGKVSRIGVEEGLNSEIILRIKKDTEQSAYWIITSNSISYMKDEEIRTLLNFPYSNNFDLYFDNGGGVWILSSNGIYVVNKEQLLADEELEYDFFDTQCGLPSVATANSRSFLADNGTLYIAGTMGVSSININEVRNEAGSIKLAVPFVEVDDRIITLQEGETVTIPADCKRLTIYSYALTYALQNPWVNYYLEGFDEEAISVSKQDMQPVSYTNLDSGEYVFHLSIVNTMTGEEEGSIAVSFVKEKAFYEHGWFRACIVALLLLVSVGISILCIHYRTVKLLKKQEENKTFINQVIHAFGRSIDLKDKCTNGHSARVAEYARMIAEQMGYDKERVAEIYNIGLLHDIGKITVPDEILTKPGKLTDEEYEIIKQHAANGYDILKEIEISPELALGALYHHERIDGKGYPAGIKGDEIPQIAQIIAVADTFDAMNSNRPYRKQMQMEDIMKELKRVSGTQLNAEIVQVLLTLIEKGAIGADKADKNI